MEIKAFLEAVHGMEVERVSTINYQGKRKRRIDSQGKPHWVRLSDWKKTYVLFKAPQQIQKQWQRDQKQQQRERTEQAQQQGKRLPKQLRSLLGDGLHNMGSARTNSSSSSSSSRDGGSSGSNTRQSINS
jgi:hypothetical protein